MLTTMSTAHLMCRSQVNVKTGQTVSNVREHPERVTTAADDFRLYYIRHHLDGSVKSSRVLSRLRKFVVDSEEDDTECVGDRQ